MSTTLLITLTFLSAIGSGLIAGALLYLIGSIGVTMAPNVPLNDTLAVVDPTSEGAQGVWTAFLTDWTRWNHLRTLASLEAAFLTVGLCK